MRKPALTAGSRLCECGACGLHFASPKGFDLHRRGGKCLTKATLRRAGWKVSRGFWTVPREEKDGRAVSIQDT